MHCFFKIRMFVGSGIFCVSVNSTYPNIVARYWVVHYINVPSDRVLGYNRNKLD